MRTNFIPIISACILPIYMRTDSWVYSIAVSVMALLIIVGQWFMEKYHWLETESKLEASERKCF